MQAGDTAEPGVTPTPPGRPRNEELTRRLQDCAIAMIAESGFKSFTYERLAQQTGAGKAGIYRRWPEPAYLAADALHGHRLIPPTPDTGSLTGDLRSILGPFIGDLTVHDRFAGSLLGPARHLPVLADALTRAVATPLATATATISAAHHARRPATDGDPRMLTHLLQALWWDRLITERPPWSPAQLTECVDGLTRTFTTRTPP
jgi:AcrR family transcriptional regulator